MRKIYQWLIAISCLLVFVGFVSSRALASIAMIAMLVITFLTFHPREIFGAYFRRKDHLVLAIFFLIVLFSGIYSDDKQGWMNWLRIKLPYLALPLAWAVIPRLGNRVFITILYAFILTFAFSAVLVLANYALHYEQITQSFSRGNGIPMPFSHIRYSLMLAFAFFCCLYLFSQRLYIFSRRERWLQGVTALFIFAALHILTVRSGLLALYLGLLTVTIVYLVKRRQWLYGLLMLVVIFSTPFVAYRYVESFHNKIEYMLWDLDRYRQGEINEYSDAMRILSIKIGWDIWKEHKFLGVGSGDIRNETYSVYRAQYQQISEQNFRLPHNQFMWVLAGTGLVGLVLFLFAFLFPLLYHKQYRNWLLVVFYLMMFSSFFTEHTLEEQIGTGFFVLMLMILLNHLQDEPNE